MRVSRTGSLGSAATATLLLLFAHPLAAQQGTLTGRVTDVETGQPVPTAQVQVLGGGQSTGGLTNESGLFRFQLPAGSYSLVVEEVGHRPARFDGIRVSAGETTSYDIELTSMALALDEINITVSRGTGEKATESPATVHNISSIEISERPVTATVDHLKTAPGVDIISHGLQASNVVVRGFNNIFSGALHMLSDHRLAGVPSLRVNLMHFIPSNEQDIERIEVVLGPGSALYGPNTANGVVHILTKSPLDDQGTTLMLGGGTRDVFSGSFRSAFLVNEDLGLKISGDYLRGDEWPFSDSTEVANRESADDNPQLCLADKAIRGVTGAAAEQACGRIGVRHYDLERYSFEARADWRFSENGTLIGTYGRTQASGIELTGLGAGQTGDWVYDFYQLRMKIDRLFAQVYLNASDAGDTYLLNSGLPLVDLSKLYVGQVQHGFALSDGRQDFTYGFDYIATRPETEGNINGIYEDDDDMDEWGVYLQSKTALSEQLDLILAGRMDHHSIIEDNVYSPRAALVYRPVQDQSFRVAFNRAYSSPSSLNYFLDIQNGFAPGLAALGFGLRGFGTGRDGWSVVNDDGTLKGFRSPFNPAGADKMVPMAGTTAFWQAATAVFGAQVQARAAAGDQQAAALLPLLPVLGSLTPQPGSLGTMLYDPQSGSLKPVADHDVQPMPSIRESNTETFELGWTGILEQRLKISADVYRSTQNDFVSPLLIQTPLVMFNGQDVGGFITVPIVTAITQQLVAAGVPAAQAQQQAQQMAAQVVPAIAAGLAQVPIGVVSSPEFPGGSDLIVSYRNVGDITLYGADLAFQWFLDDSWTLNGSYSWISDDTFEIEDGPPIALNSATHKGSVGLAYRNVRAGFNAETRLRFNNEFPAVSAGYNGVVSASQIVDLSMGYRIPSTPATVQLAVTNLFDSENRSFVGVPDIGRFAMLRVKYDLF